MKELKYIVLFYMLLIPNAYAIDLIKGVSLINGMYTDAEEEFSWELDDLSPNHDVINRGFTNLGSGDIYYALYSDMNIRYFNKQENKYLGNWQLLESYPQTVMQGEILKAAKFMSDMSSDYWEVQQISAPKTGLNVVSNAQDYFPTEKQYGCLTLRPLRYGAITTNDSKDLLVLTGPNLFIFSTLLNKVIFSANWVASDEVSAEAMTSLKAKQDSENLSYLYYEYAQLGEAAPQYIAQSGDDFKVKRLFPAWRSFAKLFFDDFNNDNKPDIIMWRKLYESRLASDSVEGFNKKGELFVHYSFIDGVYTIQETPPEQIQTWLTEKNLTWQKGYPDKSECPGQEGQLIPEMHDPLLNDPDVLK